MKPKEYEIPIYNRSTQDSGEIPIYNTGSQKTSDEKLYGSSDFNAVKKKALSENTSGSRSTNTTSASANNAKSVDGSTHPPFSKSAKRNMGVKEEYATPSLTGYSAGFSTGMPIEYTTGARKKTPVSVLHEDLKRASVLTRDQLDEIDKEVEISISTDPSLVPADRRTGGLVSAGFSTGMPAYMSGAISIQSPYEKDKPNLKKQFAQIYKVPINKIEESDLKEFYVGKKKDELSHQMKKQNLENYIEDMPTEDKSRLEGYKKSIKVKLSTENTLNMLAGDAAEENAVALKAGMENGTIPHNQENIQKLDNELADMYDYRKKVSLNKENIGAVDEELDLLKRNYGGLENFFGKSLAGITEAILGLGRYAEDLLPFTNMSPKSTLNILNGIQNESSNTSNIGKYLEALPKNIRDNLRETKSISELSSVGDIPNWVLDTAGETVATIGTIMATGGTAGVTILASAAYGNKLRQIEDEERATGIKYTPLQKRTSAFLAAGGSAVVLGATGGLLSKATRLFQSSLNSGLEKEIKVGMFKSISKKLGNFGIDSQIQGGAGMVEQLSHNVADKYILGKNDVKMSDGMFDAYASNVALTAIMHVTPLIGAELVKPFFSNKTKSEIGNNLAKINELSAGHKEVSKSEEILKSTPTEGEVILKDQPVIQEKQNVTTDENVSKPVDITAKEVVTTEPIKKGVVSQTETITDQNKNVQPTPEVLDKTVSEVAKGDPVIPSKNNVNSIIESKIAELDAINSKIISDRVDAIANLPKDQVAEVLSIDDKMGKLKKDYSEVANNRELSDDQKKILLESLNNEYEDISSRKNKIVDDSLHEIALKKEEKKPTTAEDVNQETVNTDAINDQPNKPETLTTKQQPNEKINEQLRDKNSEESRSDNAIKKTEGEYQNANSNEVGKKIAAKESLNESNDLGAKAEDKAAKKSGSLDEFKNLDLSDSSGLRKAYDYLDYLDDNLKQFGKENLSIGLPIIIARGAVKAMKAATKIYKIGSDVIKAGLDYVRSTKWYKKITDAEKKNIDENLHDILFKKVSKEEGYEKNIADSRGDRPKSLLHGIPVASYIDAIIARHTQKGVEYVSKKIKAGVTHKNDIVRTTSKLITALFNELPRTAKEVTNRSRFFGKQDLAKIVGKELSDGLKNLVDNDIESLGRVHSALDPEIYLEKDQINYKDLTDNEKLLFDQLKTLNRQTHERNFSLGLIPLEVYNKYKDNYIRRAYEPFEEQTFLQKLFSSKKARLEFQKKRQEMDKWKQENKIVDPVYLTVSRAVELERNAAVLGYASDLRKQGISKNSEQAGYVQLKGKGYGALNGKYVPKHIAEDFLGYSFTNEYIQSIYELVNAYDKTAVRQFIKKSVTVYLPSTRIGNVSGNFSFAMKAGINPSEFARNYKKAIKDIKNTSDLYKDLVGEGMLRSNLTGADISPIIPKNILKSIIKENPTLKDKILKTLNNIDTKATESYGRADDIAKVAAYRSYLDQGYSKDIAVKKVFESFQNYNKIGKIWDLTSKIPIIGPTFIKFKANLLTLNTNAVLKNPLSTAAYYGSIMLMSKLTSYLSGESDEEKEFRESKPFSTNIDLMFKKIPLKFRIGNKVVDLSRYIATDYGYDNPNETLTERLSKNTPMPLRYDERLRSYVPTTGDVLLGPIAASLFTNIDFRNKPIDDPKKTKYGDNNLSEGTEMLNRANYSARSLVPFFAMGEDAYLSNRYGVDFYGRDKSFSDILVSKFIKIETYDDTTLKKDILSRYKSMDYKKNDIISKKGQDLASYKKNVRNLDKSLDEGVMTLQQYKRNQDYELSKLRARQKISTEKLDKVKKEDDALVKQVTKLIEVTGIKMKESSEESSDSN